MNLNVIAICLVAAAGVLFLKQHRPEFALILSAAAGILVLIYLMEPTLQILGAVKERLESAGVSSVFSTLLKVIGICYITDFAADICRDFGQSSLAAKVETAGKISVVGLCLPLVDSLLKITDRLMG